MLPEFAQSLYERFEREGIPLLLAGGWAVCHHGYARITFDFDWVCPLSRVSAAPSLMEELGFLRTTDGMASRYAKKGDLAFPFIDLIPVDDATFSRMAEAEPAAFKPQGVPVINFRALLAMKLFALKDDETRHGKDLLDIRMLLRYGHCQIPEEEIKALCAKFAGPVAYAKIRPEP